MFCSEVIILTNGAGRMRPMFRRNKGRLNSFAHYCMEQLDRIIFIADANRRQSIQSQGSLKIRCENVRRRIDRVNRKLVSQFALSVHYCIKTSGNVTASDVKFKCPQQQQQVDYYSYPIRQRRHEIETGLHVCDSDNVSQHTTAQ